MTTFSQQVSLPELEKRILSYWRERGIVERGLSRNQGAEEWVFYEGPPTANGKPGVHHVETRTFKDVFLRYRAMRGFHVRRRAGWDCHGLPVELEVEKQLGLGTKREIEEFGVERFNEECRRSVQRYVNEWEALTERIAFWISIADAYWTMDPAYIESVWWSLKTLHGQGLLVQDYRSTPYCPRCETGLSRHEQDQPGAYKTVKDPSVFVRLPVKSKGFDLLVWTTTPWTLPSNLAAAIRPDVPYAVVETEGRPVVVAEPLVATAIGPRARTLKILPAQELVGHKYSPPFRFVEFDRPAWFIVAEDFVNVSEGTGIVHVAPAFGAEDLEVARHHDLPIVNLIDRTGRFVKETGPYAGLTLKEADPKIIADLKNTGHLFKEELYEHNYPHCWRCGTPLIYYAKESWFVRTTAQRDELLDQNQKTNWFPDTIKDGRYGEWLRNNVDWALSRDRYWGTPLPVWRCPNRHDTVVGSLADLSKLTQSELGGLDPHRPYIDRVTFPCSQCGQIATRVPEVIDAWYDSGSMPYAQWEYPSRGREAFERGFPADFIAEALDQTRGWFYTLMATSTLLFGQNSYRNVLCLGLLVDAHDRKMSTSLGNVIDPWELIDRVGADALRWWMVTSGSAWANRKISLSSIEEVLRRYLLTLWNTYSFFKTYSAIDEYRHGLRPPVPRKNRLQLDCWILSELEETVREVTGCLEKFDAFHASRRLDKFVDNLSNWYVRRSRGRFWRQGRDQEKWSAYDTLCECLVTVAKLTAPFTPFIAEEIYINITGRESVHLDNWPSYDPELVDLELASRMEVALKVISLGRTARGDVKIKTRQPLPKALVVLPHEDREGFHSLEDLVKDELNVKAIEIVDSLGDFVDYVLKPNFKTLGPRLGSKVHVLGAALKQLEEKDLHPFLFGKSPLKVTVDGETFDLAPQDVDVRVIGKHEYAVAFEGDLGIAFLTNITPELKREGISREIVRVVNQARKSAELAISDRIHLFLHAPGEIARAIAENRDWIASEVLAASWAEDSLGLDFSTAFSLDGQDVQVSFSRI